MPTKSMPPNNVWLHRCALLAAAGTLALLGIGGLVTSHGAGMAVPDWPNTYGYNLFLFPPSKWIGGIFYEHTHRLVAAGVGLLTTILAAWLWARETRGRVRWVGITAVVAVLAVMGVREMPVYVAVAALAPAAIAIGLWQFRRNPGALRWLGMAALAAVILQGVLGGLRVVWFKDSIGIFHAALAQLFFVLMCALALLTSRWWQDSGRDDGPGPADAAPETRGGGDRNLRRLVLVTTLMIFGQLVLGATMRHQHAGLAIPDFPLAYGKLWPTSDANSILRYNQQRVEVVALNPITAFQIYLQMAHRLMALLILAGVASTAARAGRQLAPRNPLRRLAAVWLGLILAQIGLGAWTIWSDKAADVATAHVHVGALSLVTGAMGCLLVLRRTAPVSGTGPAAAPSDALRAGWLGTRTAAASK